MTVSIQYEYVATVSAELNRDELSEYIKEIHYYEADREYDIYSYAHSSMRTSCMNKIISIPASEFPGKPKSLNDDDLLAFIRGNINVVYKALGGEDD